MNCSQCNQKMFCYQCEQTAKGRGCDYLGICGKTPDIAALQDLLVYGLKGLSVLTIEARKNNIETAEINRFICEGLFATVTNVDFDSDRLFKLLQKLMVLRNTLLQKFERSVIQALSRAITFKLGNNKQEAIEQSPQYGVCDVSEKNADIQSLKNTVLYGLKGMSAYLDHAAILGKEDKEVYYFIQKALSEMLRYDLSLEHWINLAMQCGQANLKAMELLDRAHTEHYGHPVPTQVPLGHKKGKAILISGHDLRDLELLLEQTKDKDIFIYTHGEMLPAHGYPKLKAYKHFYGHYGTAWQNQHKEFEAFPGAILMTTNCLQKPLETYQDRIFTTGLVAWPGIIHIDEKKDFLPMIEKALSLPDFKSDENPKSVTVGFGHQAVLSIADRVIDAVKQGKIRHFFLVGGCDGAKPGRNYYTQLVEQVPKDCVVLTLACGKFRFFDKSLGEIDGIPRLIDVGQCNDAYSAIQIALALSKAFNVDVNELPLTLILSWYEQKAVAILLTLLSLGIKNIRLGPSLPAFITPNVLKFLIEKFNIQLITTPEKDLKEILKNEA